MGAASQAGLDSDDTYNFSVTSNVSQTKADVHPSCIRLYQNSDSDILSDGGVGKMMASGQGVWVVEHSRSSLYST